MKNTLGIVVGALLGGTLATPAQATLDPIVYGEERTEEIGYCLTLDHSLQALAEEQKSIESGESYETFFDRTASLARSLNCNAWRMTYTPVKGICEGKAYALYPNGKREIGPTRLIEINSGKNTFYAFSIREVPEKLPSCLEVLEERKSNVRRELP